MLYLDYSREAGQWLPNHLGGRENLDSVSFFRELNETLYAQYPGIQTIAEESTSWSGVSHPTYTGGLGFGMKWMMGWMNDSLRYFERDPFYRQHHQNELTFSLVYAFTENFMLPLSHDEVVHGKRSMVYKMPGDDWQRMANLRLLYGWMYTHPGAKLLFMGCEFGQTKEWNHETSLDWHLLDFEPHQGLLNYVKALNALYRESPGLYELGMAPNGFEWIDNSDHANSVLVFLRRGQDHHDDVVVVMNMTPVPRHNYRIGIPSAGSWKEVLNSDSAKFGGSNMDNNSILVADLPWQGRSFSAEVQLPPLGIVIIKQEMKPRKKRLTL
jgi:1,4-alpha-glucan branching enzyme